MKLYGAHWCWYCARVIQKLVDLKLDYEFIEVPVFHGQRGDVKRISGQTSIPVLVDGDTVLDDDDIIIAYLERRYGAKAS